MDKPLISIIIPVYKVEKYLRQCLDSVINQTYSNLEIILVDDGSPDSCPAICDDYAKNDSRVKVIHKENGGASDARNFGLKIANGDLITFVDSDDYIDLNTYSEITSFYENNDIDLFRYNLVEEFEDKKVVAKSQFESGFVNKIDLIESFLNNEINGWTPLWVFKKGLLKNDISFKKDLIICEDFVFAFELVCGSNNIYIINEPFYHYRYNLNSISRSSNNIIPIISGYFDVYSNILDIMQKNDLDSIENVKKFSTAIFIQIVTLFNKVIKNNYINEGLNLIIYNKKYKRIIDNVDIKKLTLYKKCFYFLSKNNMKKMLKLLLKIKNYNS